MTRAAAVLFGLALAALSLLLAASVPDCLAALPSGAGTAGFVAVGAVAWAAMLGYIAGAAIVICALESAK